MTVYLLFKIMADEGVREMKGNEQTYPGDELYHLGDE
jgi:hypothetical protein